jgi:hypothetical protein
MLIETNFEINETAEAGVYITLFACETNSYDSSRSGYNRHLFLLPESPKLTSKIKYPESFPLTGALWCTDNSPSPEHF